MTVDDINADVYRKASVNREHVLEFLRLQDTSDSVTLQTRTRDWLSGLHNDPAYSKVVFSDDALDRVLGDLGNYGYVTQETIQDAPAVEL